MKYPVLTIYALLVGMWMFAAAAEVRAEPMSFEARITLPQGATAVGIIASFYTDPPTAVENYWAPAMVIPLGDDLILRAEIGNPEVSQVEISGPGIRRARFPVEPNGDRRPVFQMEAGGSIQGKVTDSEGQPIGDALIGPIIPGANAGPEVMTRSYPFFVKADDSGSFQINGLMTGVIYDFPVSADGYARRQFTTGSGESGLEWRLPGGGVTIRGQVLDELSTEPVAGVIASLTGETLTVEHRTDEQGKFAIGGLPAGFYTLLARTENSDLTLPEEIYLEEDSPNPERTIFIPGPIRVSGQIVDDESGMGIPNVFLRLGEKFLRSDATGRFSFQDVSAPWPRRFMLESDDYTLQETEPVDGRSGPVEDLVLRARLNRFLEVYIDGHPEIPPQTFLTLHRTHPGPKETKRYPVSNANSVFPLSSSGERLGWIRSPRAGVSSIVSVHTELDATTTTLNLELGEGAILDARLRLSDGEAERPATEYELTLSTTMIEHGAEWQFLEGRPNGDGRVRWTNLPPGRFTATFKRKGTGAVYASEDVHLIRGETAQLDILGEEGRALEGRVVDSNGKPLAEIPVVAYGADTKGEPLRLQQQSEMDGSFRLLGFGGEVVNRVQVQHFHFQPKTLDNIALSQPFEIVLESRQMLSAPVKGDYTNAVAYLLEAISTQAPDGSEQYISEIAGKAIFENDNTAYFTPRGAGRYRVAANLDGEWAVSRAVQWAADNEATEVPLDPQALCMIKVAVAGAELEAVEPVLLNTTLPEEMAVVEFEPEIRSDRLVYADLPPGDYILLITAETGETSTLAGIDLSPGESLDLYADLREALVALQGRVLYGTAPLPNATVDVRFADVPESEVLRSEVTNSSGRFSIEAMPAGRHFVFEIAANGESTRFYETSPEKGGEWKREFTIIAPIAVDLVIPVSIQTRIDQVPQIPLLFIAMGGGETETVFTQNIPDLRLRPGEYRVNLGEDSVGTIVVPDRRRGPVRVEIEEYGD